MNRATLIALASLMSPQSQAANSAFATVQFGEVAQIALPRSWTYMDKQVADHLNTSSEAVGRLSGLTINQGDNKVLVAANARDSKGKTKATIRLSVRMGPSPTQADVRDLAKEPPNAIEGILLPAAKETVDAMLKVPGVTSYRIRGVKIDKNKDMSCTLSSFEGDHGSGLVETDTWVCPLGDRTIKLSTSYHKDVEQIYRPTIEYVWRSLRATSLR
jgi:hypothetical protein